MISVKTYAFAARQIREKSCTDYLKQTGRVSSAEKKGQLNQQIGVDFLRSYLRRIIIVLSAILHKGETVYVTAVAVCLHWIESTVSES